MCMYMHMSCSVHQLYYVTLHHINYNPLSSITTLISLTLLHTMIIATYTWKLSPAVRSAGQPLPPSFACAKAVTLGAGFIERQRLQLDMKSPLGGDSCFRIQTTIALDCNARESWLERSNKHINLYIWLYKNKKPETNLTLSGCLIYNVAS